MNKIRNNAKRPNVCPEEENNITINIGAISIFHFYISIQTSILYVTQFSAKKTFFGGRGGGAGGGLDE